MPGLTYERYGLTGNPFRDLAVENLEDVTLFHVNQDVDQTLRTIKDEVYDKEGRAAVAVLGGLGTGKTERLRVALAEAKEHHAFAVYFDVTEKLPGVLRGLAHEFRSAAEAAGLAKTFSAPGWYRPVVALEKLKDENYDPAEAGRSLARALNEAAPSFLLLNDLHNLVESREVNAFVNVLEELTNSMRPGVLLMFTSYASYRAWLAVNHPAFASRINRTFNLVRLTNDEATLLLAKKLLAKRVVEDLDPTYPFDADAVVALNAASGGNPRRLLELADLSIEYALAHRAYRVDPEMIRSVVAPPPLAEAPAPPSSPSSSSAPAPAPPLAGGVPPSYRETDAT